MIIHNDHPVDEASMEQRSSCQFHMIHLCVDWNSTWVPAADRDAQSWHRIDGWAGPFTTVSV